MAFVCQGQFHLFFLPLTRWRRLEKGPLRGKGLVTYLSWSVPVPGISGGEVGSVAVVCPPKPPCPASACIPPGQYHHGRVYQQTRGHGKGPTKRKNTGAPHRISGTKNQPKEEVLGTDIPRTSGGHSRGYPGPKLRSGPSTIGKTSIWARTSMTRRRGRPRP